MTLANVDGSHHHNPSLSADVYADDGLVQDLTATLRSRLVPASPSADLEHLVRSALAELAPVHVTNYLGVLVERRLKVGGHAKSQPG